MFTTLFAFAVPFALVMSVILILVRLGVLTLGKGSGIIGWLLILSWVLLALSGGVLLAGILVG